MIGYSRVSTKTDQRLDLQTDALTTAGCRKIFSDVISGSTTSRPQLDACLDYLREGDTLVVWKLDRLGRSLRHLLEIIDELRAKGIGFKSLSDGIDTTTASGKMMFSVMGAFAEFERDLIKERTNSGLQAARDRGRLGGRPAVITEELAQRISSLRDEGKSPTAIAKELEIGRATVYRHLKQQPAAV
ncbi:recombinase family protein [Arthrobacter sp. GCM10027362]|uniref:recombinase family protein n=1 Tax=Arthrobacter sp. GCM10027362 TaxID=3273379 RepID=UPI003632D617